MYIEKETLKVIITVGLPASGKSTWAIKHIMKNQDYVRINRDDIRNMLRNRGTCDPNIEKLISEIQDKAIVHALVKKMNVIIDSTNLKLSRIQHFIELVEDYANVSFMHFDVPPKTCIARDKERSDSVGEANIMKMYEDYKILVDTYDFQPVNKRRTIKTITPDFTSDLPQAIIVDIDGTLTVGPHKTRSPYELDLVDRDEPNNLIIELVQFHKSKDRKIIIVSGRDEYSRKLTIEWLDFYGVPYDYLFMRPDGIVSKDSYIKKEIYNENIRGIYNVICVIDDRLQVLEMWNSLGLYTFNVNQYQKLF